MKGYSQRLQGHVTDSPKFTQAGLNLATRTELCMLCSVTINDGNMKGYSS